jgi:hypothetical protein
MAEEIRSMPTTLVEKSTITDFYGWLNCLFQKIKDVVRHIV